jgi:hypothetical protein
MGPAVKLVDTDGTPSFAESHLCKGIPEPVREGGHARKEAEVVGVACTQTRFQNEN